MNPRTQHEAQAKKILARRANSKSNTKKAIVIVEEDDGMTDSPAPETPAVPEATPAPETQFGGMSVKELRAECKAQGIEFKKKDTVAQLIEKLEA